MHLVKMGNGNMNPMPSNMNMPSFANIFYGYPNGQGDANGGMVSQQQVRTF
jgi:hypothetical protein